MALPIRPGQGLPTNRPIPKATPTEESALPSLPALPEVVSPPPRPAEEKRPTVAKEPVQRSSKTPPPARPKEPRDPHADDPNWRVDPTTGKRYKKIAGYKEGVMKSRAAVTSVSKGKISMEQLRMMVEEEPDFNLDDLNGSAETFLSHLRVPPNKEEQKKLMEERAARQKQYDEQASRAAAAEAAEEDSLS